jgi:SAM-dependent methyltransferase
MRSKTVADDTSNENAFFDSRHRNLVDSPNGRVWFMSMPLPNGDRISGVNGGSRSREQDLWLSCFPDARSRLRGKRVLDLGANDGYFTIAALLSGAASATAVNLGAPDYGHYPHNLEHAARAWGVTPEIVVGDFLSVDLEPGAYDIIFFFGVLYHLENVFAGFRKLKQLLARDGTIFLETQMTAVACGQPIFEMASDSFPTTVPQSKSALHKKGNSNFLLPNELVVRCLADTFDLTVGPTEPKENVYELSAAGMRRLFVLRHAS